MALPAECSVDQPAIDVARSEQSTNLVDMLQRLAASSGRPLGSVLGDFIRTSFGPGRLSFDEFVALGLYDPARYRGSDLRGFAGLGAMQRIWRRANYRSEFDGLIRNKIAMTSVLEAHGLPVIPIAAVYSTAGRETARALHAKAALRTYLASEAAYPLFGKPADGHQSLGSIAIAGYDATRQALRCHGGDTKPLDSVVDDVASHFGGGYLVQPRISPHFETKAICGDRLATVRVVTAVTRAGAKILRICEKIPAGANVADNYWRSGNLLVTVDRLTGARRRAISGKGFDLKEHSRHPDSGMPVVGTVVPNWIAVCELALEAACLMKETALLGWDIAPVDDGAVIVEANVTPDLMLPQLADRKGILDAELRGFLGECRAQEKGWKRELRATSRKQHRASFMN
jgi:hypothetical protein